MSTLREYAVLLRFHHYIKNLLIFIPPFFSRGFLNIHSLAVSLLGFVVFSILSSIVYLLNDIRDIEKDRQHPTKCLRPLASGSISISRARIIMGVLSGVLIFLVFLLGIMENRPAAWAATGLLGLYAALNIGYSYGLKNIPLVDISILASGYIIRVLFGALLIGKPVSVWLYLVITLGAYYLGLGKRRNEIAETGRGSETRAVMRFYSHNFLDKNMYMCQALCVVFYALWSIDTGFVYTIPLVLIILLKYSLNIETDADGDPTSIVLHDKLLLLLCVAYLVWAFCIIYFNRNIP